MGVPNSSYAFRGKEVKGGSEEITETERERETHTHTHTRTHTRIHTVWQPYMNVSIFLTLYVVNKTVE